MSDKVLSPFLGRGVHGLDPTISELEAHLKEIRLTPLTEAEHPIRGVMTQLGARLCLGFSKEKLLEVIEDRNSNRPQLEGLELPYQLGVKGRRRDSTTSRVTVYARIMDAEDPDAEVSLANDSRLIRSYLGLEQEDDPPRGRMLDLLAFNSAQFLLNPGKRRRDKLEGFCRRKRGTIKVAKLSLATDLISAKQPNPRNHPTTG